jgi:hypothetical protein
MRKLLILSALLLTAGTTGCTRGPCGETWRPGYYLFGAGRQNYQYQNQNYQYQNYQQPGGGYCCDSYGSADATMMAPGPEMTQAPCCQ